MNTVYDAFVASAQASPGSAFLCTPEIAMQGGPDILYGEALKQVAEIREAYRRAGYGHGHRIALLLGQSPALVYHFLALNGLGCTVVPINPDYRHDELFYLIDHSDSDIAVVGTDRVPDLETVAAALTRTLPVIDAAQFADQLPPASRAAPEPGAPDIESVCSILYTSGTTGMPKGCVLTNYYHLTVGAWYRNIGGVLTINEGTDRFYNPTPFHHVNNLAVGLTCAILSKNCAILPERFSPSRWWPEIVASRATIMHYLGIVPSVLMNAPAAPQDRAHCVRFGFGAGVEPQLHKAFEDRFGFPLVEIWGMTESARVFSDNIEPRQIETRAFGGTPEGYEARLVDDEDHDVPRGMPGEFLVRSPGPEPRRGFFSGYLKEPEATETAWRGGWFHTGDIATQSDDGMFYFVDRKKNIIRRAGENISAAEVEATIQTHGAVAQVAVIAVSDEVREEEVMACIVAADGVLPSPEIAREIFAWCHQKIAYYKAPGWVIFLDELPVTPSQRLQRTKIFPAGEDPRRRADAIDLRSLKKRG